MINIKIINILELWAVSNLQPWYSQTYIPTHRSCTKTTQCNMYVQGTEPTTTTTMYWDQVGVSQ